MSMMYYVIGILLVVLAFKFLKKIGKFFFTLLLIAAALLLIKGIFDISIISLVLSRF